MKERIAVYAGSFDPPTYGHLWMIQKSSELFDKVIIGIGINASKKSKYMFTLEERVEMLNRVIDANKFNNVEVCSYEDMYLVDFAVDKHAQYLIRGIRNDTDYHFEKGMLDINREITSEYSSDMQVETVFIIPPSNIGNISSSMVKELIGYHGWRGMIQKFVPNSVHGCILKKIGENK